MMKILKSSLLISAVLRSRILFLVKNQEVRQQCLVEYTCHLPNGLKFFHDSVSKITQPVGPQTITKQAQHKF